MKGLKTGGRQKGTPNKTSMAVPLFLQKNGMNLVEEAIDLYRSTSDPEFKLKILTLLFPYAHARKVESSDEALDITPENELEIAKETIDYISQKFPHLLTAKNE
jgi:hypothetical protein